MLHPVQQKVAAINRRARRLRRVSGVGVWVALAVAAAFLLGAADYLLRFQDPGVRYLSSLGLLAALAGSGYRFLYPAWQYRPSDRQVAQRIEQHFPQLQERLSSAIEFLGQSENDLLAGSPDLRRAVIITTAGQIERLNFGTCLDARRPRWSVVLASMICLIAAAVCSLDVNATWLAARRLAQPWRGDPWPRRYELEFVKQPTRIAAGTDFEVELIGRAGHLPDVVRLYCWFEGESERQAQAFPMKPFGDKLVYRQANVRRSFRYRAVGGDDDTMPWTVLEVVEPPHVESLTNRLHPPAYTGWPVEACGENLLALEGTRVEVAGRLTQPASAVELQTDHPARPQAVPARLASDGTTFQIPADAEPAWTLTDSAAYWFVVTDAAGLQGGSERRWNARVVRDAPPTVSVDKPGANTFVTRRAVVTIMALVKDDLAIHTIELRFRRSDVSDQEESVSLYRGSDLLPRAQVSSLSLAQAQGESRPVSYAWELSQLPNLAPGRTIEFTVAASDYKPQVGQCTPRRLTVISAQELEDRIAARQVFILGQLAEVLRVQRETRLQTKSLEIQAETVGRLTKTDIDQLQAGELSQRQVARLLADPQDGVQVQITSLLDELTSNRLGSPEVARRMQELLKAVQQLQQQPLPEIERNLIRALKVARESLSEGTGAGENTPDPAALRAALRGAGEKQDEVIATLENLLGEFTQWDSYRRFAREISRLRQSQQQLRQDTEQTRLDTLGKDLNQLSSQEQANLKRLAERQAELARQFDRIQGRMAEMQIELRETEPLAAETLADALEVARRTAIGGKMRESGRDIERNRVGQATQTQQDVLTHLQDLLETLANRREHELERRLRKWEEAATALKQLRDGQRELRGRLEQAAKTIDGAARRRHLEQLSREQKALAEQAERLARQLQRLQAERASELLQQAAAQQQQAAQAGQQGDQRSALEKAREAERLLDQAEQQLEAQRRQAGQDLFQELLARLEKELQGLVSRQQSLLATTTELDGLRQQQGGTLRREQLASVRDLVAQQRSLAGEVCGWADKVRRAEAFALGFRGAGQEMERAARHLDAAETGEPAQLAEQQALTRLQQLLEALQRDPAAKPPPEGGSGKGGEATGLPPGDAIRRLAELKLLKLMQEEIHRRTRELEDARVRQKTLSQEQNREVAELAQQQGQLADLLLNLSQPREPPGVQAPESPLEKDGEQNDGEK
jgi:hypothetical protein